jgi:hypothetical protein
MASFRRHFWFVFGACWLVVSCSATPHPLPPECPTSDPLHPSVKSIERVCDPSQPFVLDLSTQSLAMIRATLQSGKGLIAVRYVGCKLEVLGGCTVPGTYDAVTLAQPSTESLELGPGGREAEGALTRGFAEVHGGGSFRVTTAEVMRTTAVPPLSDDLGPDCERATHFVSDVGIGSAVVFDGKSRVILTTGCANLDDVPELESDLKRICGPEPNGITDRWKRYSPLRVTLVAARPGAKATVKCGDYEQPGAVDPKTQQVSCVPTPWPLPPVGSAELAHIQAVVKKVDGSHADAVNLELAQAYERAQMPEGVVRALKPLVRAKADSSVIFSYALAQRALKNEGAFLEALRSIVAQPERSDDRARANYELVSYFCSLGQRDNARGFFETLGREFPSSKWWQTAQPIATKCQLPTAGAKAAARAPAARGGAEAD